VLQKVKRSTDSALTELRLLVRVLRDNPTTAAGPDEVSELSQRIPPTQRALDLARELTNAGFEPAIEVPDEADRLEGTVQATVSRTLDVICDNILRHSPRRSRCTITVSVDPTEAVVWAASPLASSPPSEPVGLGSGLRGLRERVDLTGGTFSAGPSSETEQPQWVVVVTLPHD
jgi:glucose-6-phosphate-specific signal transduction histidine kinase